MEKIMYAIEMQNITKTFGNIKVLDEINLSVKKGSVHALIGENGAGKSTLMSILFGIYDADYGTIKINGTSHKISNPQQANDLGIGMVHQHFKLVENMTVIENILLGDEITKMGIVSKKSSLKRVNSVLNKYNITLDLKPKVRDIPVSQQQRLEIVKMLYKDSDILIFDEPTAVLSPEQIIDFIEQVKYLKNKGKTIIIISHKLNELRQVADYGTVIRLGKVVKSFSLSDHTNSEIADLMVGRSVKTTTNDHSKVSDQTVLLQVKDLTVESENNHKVNALNSISFTLKSGEILGIAGVAGNGQAELALSIAGLIPSKKGSISSVDVKTKKMQSIEKSSIKSIYRSGIRFVPEDRQRHGLFLDETVNINTISRNVDTKVFSWFGFINYSNVDKRGKEIVNSYDVRNANNGFAVTRGLSGGNQQKVILGRELFGDDYNIVVICQPTRGLDVGSIEYIHSQIVKARNSGKAILLISYELDELINLSDRLLVINSGKFVGELNASNNEINQSNIAKLMAGVK
jgi:ABC-type uncharacterized transport system ATPase subunit